MGDRVSWASFPDENPLGWDATVPPCLVEHAVLRCDWVVYLWPSMGKTGFQGSHRNTPSREAVVRRSRGEPTGRRTSALPPGRQQKYQTFLLT